MSTPATTLIESQTGDGPDDVAEPIPFDWSPAYPTSETEEGDR